MKRLAGASPGVGRLREAPRQVGAPRRHLRQTIRGSRGRQLGRVARAEGETCAKPVKSGQETIVRPSSPILGKERD